MSKVNKPKRVILHCTATPDYTYGIGDFDRFKIADVDRWHRARGWDSCGYHMTVSRSGIIEFGRPMNIIGAHTLGHNKDTLGIAYFGSQNPTKTQLRELLNLYVLIKKTTGINYNGWFGHNEFNKFKSCPGFSMEIFRHLLKQHDQLLFANQ